MFVAKRPHSYLADDLWQRWFEVSSSTPVLNLRSFLVSSFWSSRSPSTASTSLQPNLSMAGTSCHSFGAFSATTLQFCFLSPALDVVAALILVPHKLWTLSTKLRPSHETLRLWALVIGMSFHSGHKALISDIHSILCCVRSNAESTLLNSWIEAIANQK